MIKVTLLIKKNMRQEDHETSIDTFIMYVSCGNWT